MAREVNNVLFVCCLCLMMVNRIECVPYPLAGRRHHDNTQTNKPSQA